MKVRSQTSGRAPGEKDGLGVTEVVLFSQRLYDCIDDALAAKVDLLTVDNNRVVGISREGVAVTVRHVHTVEVAVVLGKWAREPGSAARAGQPNSGLTDHEHTGFFLQSADMMPPSDAVLAQVLEDPSPECERPQQSISS